MKILICFGTRPEAIKMAPVIHELRKQNVGFKVCVTAQHREMLDQVLDFFELVPDHDLNLMQHNQTLNELSSRIFLEIDKVFKLENPELVLVQGDTTTAAIVAMAAFNNRIKIGHIEAGLRTYNNEPFPEEGNRQLISRIADFHFAPTLKAMENLLNEQILRDKIFCTGNTIVDALNWAKEKMIDGEESQEIQILRKKLCSTKKIILVTGHRRENFGKGLKDICGAIIELSKRNDVEIIYPIHPNTNVSNPVTSYLENQTNINLTNPLSYSTILWIMQKSSLIITDSGGIQEEAPTFKKPVLVTRNFSERTEGVEAGFCKLTGTNKERIVKEAEFWLDYPPDFSQIKNPYGDGTAAKKIVSIVTE